MKRSTTIHTLILVTITTAIIGLIRPATAQTNEEQPEGCPEGFECLTSDADVCLSSNSLEEHEQNLENCRAKNRKLEGRLKESRDAESAAKARAENLAVDRARERQKKLEWKSKADRKSQKLDQWYRKPLPWIGISAGAGVLGYLIGSWTSSPKFLRELLS